MIYVPLTLSPFSMKTASRFFLKNCTIKNNKVIFIGSILCVFFLQKIIFLRFLRKHTSITCCFNFGQGSYSKNLSCRKKIVSLIFLFDNFKAPFQTYIFLGL